MNYLKLYANYRYFSYLIIFMMTYSMHAGIDSWWKNRAGMKLFKDHDYDKSLQVYNNLIDQDPYNPIFNYNVGDVLYRQNRYEEARQAFKRAVDYAQKNPQLAEYAWYGAGNSSYQLKEWQQAIDMYQEVLKLNSDNEQAKHNLRLAQEKLNKERLKDMQDKLDKKQDKKNSEQQKQEKQSENTQQNQQKQAGNDSQDSSGSSCDNPSSGSDGKGEQQGMQKKSGLEKKNEQGQHQKEQDVFDKKDALHEKEALKKDSEQNLKEQSDQQGQDELDKNASQGQEKDQEKFYEHQQRLDDVASQVANQGAEQVESDLEKDGLVPQEQINNISGDDQIQDIKDGNSKDAQGNKNHLKKIELKNTLQDLYESKSSQDARLQESYANILKDLEKQEINIQQDVIKKRVTKNMVGQHGKNSW